MYKIDSESIGRFAGLSEEERKIQKPLIEIIIDKNQLKIASKKDDFIDALKFVIENGHDECLGSIFKSVYDFLSENKNSTNEFISSLVNNIMEADRIYYSCGTCGDCGDTGGMYRWVRCCSNDHCWCPRC